MTRDEPVRPPVPRGLRPLYLVIGAWTASLSPFIAVILRSKGIDTATIGLLSALAALTGTLLVPAWGHLADVMVGRAYAFTIGLVIATGAAIALLLPLPSVLLAIILAFFAVFPIVFLALADSLAVDALPAPERQYGALRGLASLTFGVAVIMAGFLYDQVGYGAVPLLSLGGSVALMLILGRVPDRTRDPAVRALAAGHGGDEAAGRFGSVSRAFSTQPRLLSVLAVFTIAYTGLLGAGLFVSIRIVELGGQPSDVALSIGLSALAEVPGLIVAGWLIRQVGVRGLVVGTLVLFGLCIVSWGVLATPEAINATRLVTGLDSAPSSPRGSWSSTGCCPMSSRRPGRPCSRPRPSGLARRWVPSSAGWCTRPPGRPPASPWPER